MTQFRTQSSGLRENGRNRLRWVLCLLISELCVLSPELGPTQAWASGKSNVGTSGAAFLKIGPGARPAGMGDAFTAVADDLHSVYWNPAGLSRLQHPEIVGMHMQYFENIGYEFASFGVPTSHGTWAVSIANLHTDNLERRTEDTDASLGEFSASDTAYWLSYGQSITSRFSLGGSMKYIRQTLDSVDASAYAVDGGVLYLSDWHDVRLGASVQNLGSKVKFVNESDPLPRTYRLGASAPLLERRMLVSTDLILPRDHAIGAAVGTEYKGRISEQMGYAMRAGYRTDSDVSGFKGFAIGSGLSLGRGRLDFAWVPFGDLGNAYRFALHVKFGTPEGNLDVPGHRQLKSASARPDAAVTPRPKDADTSALEQLLAL